ncbi:hypothetical protein GGH96_000520 [Coemansia sp. RSA 1972]|nr:hypothetical protein GGH96_000520 [Coemansia sp. RSA 1972]
MTQDRDRVPVLRREVERPRWNSPPRVGIVYSAENWDHIEPLVNSLRYELTDNFHFSPINIKLTQAESIYDIPLYVSHLHQRSEIVFVLGVVFRTSPTFEQRLVDALTQHVAAIPMIGRLPVFDCIMVKDSEKQLRAHIEAVDGGFASVWAKRAIDTYTMMAKPAI